MPCTENDKILSTSFAEEKKDQHAQILRQFAALNTNLDEASAFTPLYCTNPNCIYSVAFSLSEHALSNLKFPSVHLSNHHMMPKVRVMAASVTFESGKVEAPIFTHQALEKVINDIIATGYGSAGGNAWIFGEVVSREKFGSELDRVGGLFGQDTKGKPKHLHGVFSLE